MLRATTVVLALLTVACGRSPAGGQGTVTVLAAASLAQPFTELEARYEAAHPGTDVVLSLGPSSSLVRQVSQGAPADVLATADETTMAALGSRAGPARAFATNRLAIVVAAGNPRNIRSLHDLADPSLTVVLCAPEVPCGRLGATALRKAGVDVRPRSFEVDVRAVVAKVGLGEADAGIGYVTEARAGGPVEVVALPPAEEITARQPIVALGGRGRPFVDLVLSDVGRQVLAAAGFGPP